MILIKQRFVAAAGDRAAVGGIPAWRLMNMDLLGILTTAPSFTSMMDRISEKGAQRETSGPDGDLMMI